MANTEPQTSYKWRIYETVCRKPVLLIWSWIYGLPEDPEPNMEEVQQQPQTIDNRSILTASQAVEPVDMVEMRQLPQTIDNRSIPTATQAVDVIGSATLAMDQKESTHQPSDGNCQNRDLNNNEGTTQCRQAQSTSLCCRLKDYICNLNSIYWFSMLIAVIVITPFVVIFFSGILNTEGEAPKPMPTTTVAPETEGTTQRPETSSTLAPKTRVEFDTEGEAQEPVPTTAVAPETGTTQRPETSSTLAPKTRVEFGPLGNWSGVPEPPIYDKNKGTPIPRTNGSWTMHTKRKDRFVSKKFEWK